MASLLCPACDKKLKINDSALGKKIKCPACGDVFDTSASTAPKPARQAKKSTPAQNELDQDDDDSGHESDDDLPRPKKKSKEKIAKGSDKPAGALMAVAVAVPMLGAIAGLIIIWLTWQPGAGLQRLMGPLFMAGGLFCLLASAFNWEWFMAFWSENAAAKLGNGGLRLMYVAIGIGLLTMGVLGAMGVIDLRSRR
jgi:hypothetical protein